MTDLFFRAYGFNQSVRNLFRIAILDPYPLDARNLSQFMQQLWKGLLTIDILAVKGGLLGYQDQFLYPSLGQLPGFLQKLFHRHAAVRPPQVWDDAVGAALITSFRYFQKSIIAASGHHPRSLRVRKFPQVMEAGQMGGSPALQHLFHDSSHILVGRSA